MDSEMVNDFLTRDDIVSLLTAHGISAQMIGRVYRRMYDFALVETDFEVVCTDCGKQVSFCRSVGDPMRIKRAKKCGGWSSDHYHIRTSSLLELASKIRAYRGRHCGVTTQTAIAIFIDALDARVNTVR